MGAGVHLTFLGNTAENYQNYQLWTAVSQCSDMTPIFREPL